MSVRKGKGRDGIQADPGRRARLARSAVPQGPLPAVRGVQGSKRPTVRVAAPAPASVAGEEPRDRRDRQGGERLHRCGLPGSDGEVAVLRFQSVPGIREIATRLTTQKYNGTKLVVILGPGDTIGLREQFENRTYYVSVKEVLELAKRVNFREGKL